MNGLQSAKYGSSRTSHRGCRLTKLVVHRVRNKNSAGNHDQELFLYLCSYIQLHCIGGETMNVHTKPYQKANTMNKYISAIVHVCEVTGSYPESL